MNYNKKTLIFKEVFECLENQSYRHLAEDITAFAQ